MAEQKPPILLQLRDKPTLVRRFVLAEIFAPPLALRRAKQRTPVRRDKKPES